MADALATGDFEYENAAFLTHCGEYMQDWLACLEALRPGTIPESSGATASADD